MVSPDLLATVSGQQDEWQRQFSEALLSFITGKSKCLEAVEGLAADLNEVVRAAAKDAMKDVVDAIRLESVP